MKKLAAVIAIGCLLFGNVGNAANPSCEAQAAEKKLSGAAKNSFVKKCQKDATAAAKAACEAQASEKKLAGAAKNSFMKMCEKDATAGT